MTKKFIIKVRSIDDTSNFDDFPDVEIALGELRPEKTGKQEERFLFSDASSS